jgi:hypothetical protein
MPMLRFVRAASCAAVLLGTTACATTKLTSTWVAPDAKALDPQKKVVAVMISERESSRLAAEDALVKVMKGRGLDAVASYTILPGQLARDTARARAVLAEQGVDAVVAARMIGKEQQTNYTPGTAYYGSTWGYWGYGWGAVYSPGYVTTDQIVTVETLVFSVSQNKLVWAGQSETTNPSNIDAFVGELASVIGGELRKSGLVPK